MIRVPIVGTTIPHEIVGRYGAGSVLLKPAPDRNGIMAWRRRARGRRVGGRHQHRDQIARSDNAHNVVRATFTGLTMLKDPVAVARMRGKTIEEMSGRPAAQAQAPAAPVAAPATEA